MATFILIFIIAMLISYKMIPVSIHLAHKIGAIDKPDGKRKLEQREVPRLGGVAIITGFVFGTIITVLALRYFNLFILQKSMYKKLAGIFCGTIIILILGLLDDSKGIKPLHKLVLQMLAAICVIISGVKVDFLVLNHLPVARVIFNYVITFCWIIGIMNAINLIDGLDGLSGGISIISLISLAIIFNSNYSGLFPILLAINAAGAIAGFLPYNWNPAKTFAGDVGSNFMGYIIAVISVIGAGKTYTIISLLLPIIVLAIPIFDLELVMIKRVIKTKSFNGILVADRTHIHHRLLEKGFDAKQVVKIIYFNSICTGLLAIIMMEENILKILIYIVLMTIFGIDAYSNYFKLRKKRILEEKK